ncbi:MAG: hypothetical protein CVU11_01705 [Bacteroidetes bacterium HGW-Bacteroidetes-6]|nr:MAG: hypothetical protein CVU11_01705 [Bacteroidetes bacterium HGW-Bacteroidetes-6]
MPIENDTTLNLKILIMKKLFTTLSITLLVFSLSAQNLIETQNSYAVEKQKADISIMSPKVFMDTLGWNDFLTTTSIWTLGYTGGGYVFGNGVDGHTTFAQGYYNVNSLTYGVTGAMVWISNIDIQSASGSDVVISLALIDDSSSYGPTGGPYFDIACPGSILSTASFNINTVDTTYAGAYGIQFVDFPTTYYFDNQDFALIFDASAVNTAGDTVGVLASDEGLNSSIFGEQYTWWLYPAATPFWTQASHVFTTAGTRMPAIFAIVDNDFVNIGEYGFFQGLQLTVSPNPTPDYVNVAYAINNEANVTIQIIDANGKIVATQEDGTQAAGTYNSTFDLSQFASGVYYCSVSSESGRLTKKFIVE